MKKLLIGLLVVILGLAALPVFFGIQTKQSFIELSQKQNDQLRVHGIEQRVEISDYQQGWLSSTALARLEMTFPAADEPVSIEMPITISHGPWPVGLEGKRVIAQGSVEADFPMDNLIPLFEQLGKQQAAEDSEEIAAVFGEIFRQIPNVRSSTVFGFDERITFNMDMNAFELSLNDEPSGADFSMNMGALSGTGHVNPDESGAYQVSFPSFTVNAQSKAGPVRVELDALSVETASDRIFDSLGSGESKIHVASYKVLLADNQVAISDILINSSLRQQAEGTDLSFTAELDSIDVQSKQAESNGIYQVKVGMQMKNMDLEALQAFNSQAQKLSQNIEAEQSQEELNKAFQTLAQKSIVRNPRLLISPIQVTHDGSTLFDLNLDLALVDADAEQALADPRSLLPHLQGKASLSASRAKVAEIIDANTRKQLKTQMQLANLELSEEQIQQNVDASREMILQQVMAQGFVVENGELLETNATLAKGLKLEVNGKVLPIADALTGAPGR